MKTVRVELWDAINDYAVACGGTPSSHVYGNTPRQRAVAAVERSVDAEIARLTAEVATLRTTEALLRVGIRRLELDFIVKGQENETLRQRCGRLRRGYLAMIAEGEASSVQSRLSGKMSHEQREAVRMELACAVADINAHNDLTQGGSDGQ